ncbi:MAG: flippase [Cytophagaceae bacterium]
MGNEKSYWISSGKFTLLERLSMLFFGVATFYLLVRVLDKEGYGTWIFYLTITTLLDTARHGFFQNPLIRFLNIDNEGGKNGLWALNKDNLQTTSFLLNLTMSSLAALLLIGIAYPIALSWDSPHLVYLFFINLLTNVFQTFFFHFEYLLKANRRFHGAFFGVFVKGLMLLIIILYFFLSKAPMNLSILAFSYAGAAFAGACTSYFFVKDLFLITLKLDRQWVKELFSYGKFTLGANISAVFMRYVDTWMIGFYISPVAVAIYNVAIRIANLFEVPSMALASMLFPEAVKRAQKDGNKAFKALYEKSVAVILLLTLPFVVGVIIFADFIVIQLAGEGYTETIGILKITMLYGLIIPFNKQMGILLDAVGKAKTNMLFVARNAVINLILNAIAIPYFGTIGAAYASLSTMVIVLILNQYYLSRTFKIELKKLFGYIMFYFMAIYYKVKNTVIN